MARSAQSRADRLIVGMCIINSSKSDPQFLYNLYWEKRARPGGEFQRWQIAAVSLLFPAFLNDIWTMHLDASDSSSAKIIFKIMCFHVKSQTCVAFPPPNTDQSLHRRQLSISHQPAPAVAKYQPLSLPPKLQLSAGLGPKGATGRFAMSS